MTKKMQIVNICVALAAMAMAIIALSLSSLQGHQTTDCRFDASHPDYSAAARMQCRTIRGSRLL